METFHSWPAIAKKVSSYRAAPRSARKALKEEIRRELEGCVAGIEAHIRDCSYEAAAYHFERVAKTAGMLKFEKKMRVRLRQVSPQLVDHFLNLAEHAAEEYPLAAMSYLERAAGIAAITKQRSEELDALKEMLGPVIVERYLQRVDDDRAAAELVAGISEEMGLEHEYSDDGERLYREAEEAAEFFGIKLKKFEKELYASQTA